MASPNPQANDGDRACCPCCGYRTLDAGADYEICPVCFWEDDGQRDADADEVRGGPNNGVSLTQARQNFREFGASSHRVLRHVRNPKPEEVYVYSKRRGLPMRFSEWQRAVGVAISALLGRRR